MTCNFTGVNNLNNLPVAKYVITATDVTQTNPLNVSTFIYDPNCALVIIGTAGGVPTIGWDAPDKRRIPVDRLYAKLKEQGSPWADELEPKMGDGLERRKQINRAHRLKWSRLYG